MVKFSDPVTRMLFNDYINLFNILRVKKNIFLQAYPNNFPRKFSERYKDLDVKKAPKKTREKIEKLDKLIDEIKPIWDIGDGEKVFKKLRDGEYYEKACLIIFEMPIDEWNKRALKDYFG